MAGRQAVDEGGIHSWERGGGARGVREVAVREVAETERWRERCRPVSTQFSPGSITVPTLLSACVLDFL